MRCCDEVRHVPNPLQKVWDVVIRIPRMPLVAAKNTMLAVITLGWEAWSRTSRTKTSWPQEPSLSSPGQQPHRHYYHRLTLSGTKLSLSNALESPHQSFDRTTRVRAAKLDAPAREGASLLTMCSSGNCWSRSSQKTPLHGASPELTKQFHLSKNIIKPNEKPKLPH
jgi:hypothetical protein